MPPAIPCIVKWTNWKIFWLRKKVVNSAAVRNEEARECENRLCLPATFSFSYCYEAPPSLLCKTHRISGISDRQVAARNERVFLFLNKSECCRPLSGRRRRWQENAAGSDVRYMKNDTFKRIWFTCPSLSSMFRKLPHVSRRGLVRSLVAI